MAGFWVLMALMAALVLVAMLWPVIKRKDEAALRADYDMKVYKDQLGEIQRDLDRGLLTEDQAKAAKTEIERRMLIAGEERERDQKAAKGGPKSAHAISMGVTGIMVAVAVGYYFETGSPNLPDQPLASRNLPASHHAAQNAGHETMDAEEQMRSMDMSIALRRLEERLEEDPQNLEGWLMLGRSYIAMERLGDAALAYKKGLDLTGGKNPILAADYGEILMSLDGNVFTEDSLKWFNVALDGDPMNAKARFYLAAKEAQDGNLQGALQDWVDLVAMSPPDAPWLDAVKYQMNRAGESLGVDVTAMKPTTDAQMLVDANPDRIAPLNSEQPAVDVASAEPGPSQADMAAAAEMSDTDRAQMIAGMVERLAERLEENPDDLAGWQRLARAYEVLGRTEEAQAALAQVQRLQQQSSAAPAPTASPVAAPGPSQEDMAAAAQMSDGDRAEMIRGMVDRLAGKLQENPDDLAGWQRLARAYDVLGETEKAQAAEAQVRRLRGQ